jgi:hypothetical protein
MRTEKEIKDKIAEIGTELEVYPHSEEERGYIEDMINLLYWVLGERE